MFYNNFQITLLFIWFRFRCFTQYCLCNGIGTFYFNSSSHRLFYSSPLLFSSLMELSPNILLYRLIYLQVSSPLIHRHTNCSLALLTSICYISSFSSECSPYRPATLQHPPPPRPPHCSRRSPPRILSPDLQLQPQPPSPSSSPQGISSTSQFSSYSGC